MISLPVSGMVISVLYAGLRLGEPVLARLHRSIWLIGQYSLGVYVFHLVLIALPVVVMGESRPLDYAWQCWAFSAALFALCYAYAFVRHGMLRRKKARAAAA